LTLTPASLHCRKEGEKEVVKNPEELIAEGTAVAPKGIAAARFVSRYDARIVEPRLAAW
jgi:hypothetical protein